MRASSAPGPWSRVRVLAQIDTVMRRRRRRSGASCRPRRSILVTVMVSDGERKTRARDSDVKARLQLARFQMLRARRMLLDPRPSCPAAGHIGMEVQAAELVAASGTTL